MNDIIIETERAYLTLMDPSHIQSMMALFNIDKEEAAKWVSENLAHQKQYGFSAWNVFDKKGAYLGYCGCRTIKLKDNLEVEMVWSIYKEFNEDDIDVEVTFPVRNFMFKHFNIHSLYAIISMKEPRNMNVAEAIDMIVEYTYFEGFHKFYVYTVNRDSERFKASFGDGGSEPQLTSTNRERLANAPSFIRNLRRPRPRPR